MRPLMLRCSSGGCTACILATANKDKYVNGSTMVVPVKCMFQQQSKEANLHWSAEMTTD